MLFSASFKEIAEMSIEPKPNSNKPEPIWLALRKDDKTAELGNIENKAPLVSVIIPAYNRAWSIERCVRSILEQTYRPIECIVVDDGSTDETPEIVKRLAFGTLKGVGMKFIQKQNGGANSARNRGLMECHGEYICYLDSDDTLPPESIMVRAELLRQHPDCGFSYGRTAILNSEGQHLRTINDPWPSISDARIASYLFTSSAPLIRRSLCMQIGPWREDDVHGQEHEYFSRLKFFCQKAAFTYDIVNIYVKHNKSHLFDQSQAFSSSVFRILCAVKSLIVYSSFDSPSERSALANDFTKLGLNFNRLGNFSAASEAFAEALCLAPTPKRFARLALSISRHSLTKSCYLLMRFFIKRPKVRNKDTSIEPVLKIEACEERSDCTPSPCSSKRPLTHSNRTVDSFAPIPAWWTGGLNNWGDIVTPFIIRALTGREVVRAHGTGSIYAVGSIITNVRGGGHVWGAGLLSRHHVPDPFPENITFHAVRGPLTRRVLRAAGLEVPEVYGDPALLMPYLCHADSHPTADVGVVLHYKDAGYIGKIIGNRSYRIIDIQSGLRTVLAAVIKCEVIVSSCLHGLILAEAYGKPAAWLKVDKCKRLAGRDFKFKDYLFSTQRKPLFNRVRGGNDLRLDRIKYLSPPIINLQLLLDAFPAVQGLTLKTLRSRTIEEL